MKYKITVLLIGIFILLNCMPVYADYMLAEGNFGTNKRIPIPDLYRVIDVKYLFGEAGALKNPADIFIDTSDNIYIADTSNNRIIKLNPDRTLNRVYNKDNSLKLSGPEGIYVDRDGDIYIADTGNERIIHITPEGKLVEVFGKPKNDMNKDEYFVYKPTKLYISMTGYMYMIRQYMLMSVDGNNSFKGFIASSSVRVSVQDLLLRFIYTDEQKAKMGKLVPETFINFFITDDGMIYGTTLTDTAQIKKINGIGKNIFKADKTYGESIVDTTGTQAMVRNPEFTDIAVDRDGIITVVDKNTNNLYQYDMDGYNIGVFGGPGLNKGQFVMPSSLAADSKGNIYVLDGGAGNLQVFEPTEYCRNIHTALVKYHNGKYLDAVKEWKKVQKMHEGNNLAHVGIAKAYYKQGQYAQAMKHYRIANDKKGYSDAYGEYRHEILRRYFMLIVLAGAAIITMLIVLSRLFKRFAEKELDQNGV